MIHLDPPRTGPWVEQWLSAARLAKYLAAADGDLEQALRLYEWNSQVSTALMRDLGHVEIALRNAYARAIDTYWAGRVDWTRSAETLFAPLYRTRNGRRVDINTQHRRQLVDACARVRPSDPPGKVIAELPFGFWRFLSSAAHEKTVWVRYLHLAFPPGTDRKRDVDNSAAALNRLRNRVAHHEPLIDENLTPSNLLGSPRSRHCSTPTSDDMSRRRQPSRNSSAGGRDRPSGRF